MKTRHSHRIDSDSTNNNDSVPLMSTLRKRFTLEEDALLKKLVLQEKISTWEEIATFMPGRNGRQCRDRFNNYLYTSISKNPWTDQEDDIIIKKYYEIGPHWTEISKFLVGRSGNNVKNRFHKHLIRTKKILPFHKKGKTFSNKSILKPAQKNINRISHEVSISKANQLSCYISQKVPKKIGKVTEKVLGKVTHEYTCIGNKSCNNDVMRNTSSVFTSNNNNDANMNNIGITSNQDVINSIPNIKTQISNICLPSDNCNCCSSCVNNQNITNFVITNNIDYIPQVNSTNCMISDNSPHLFNNISVCTSLNLYDLSITNDFLFDNSQNSGNSVSDDSFATRNCVPIQLQSLLLQSPGTVNSPLRSPATKQVSPNLTNQITVRRHFFAGKKNIDIDNNPTPSVNSLITEP
ncbi:hypothetical protein TRFO_36583 [Tritrichomonas foetus]|uniref:Myb-like DNA-binding domain containing protein n=1 Tax=Tritrichomonas foetus TaxID=1144522 RepID=A0A1J4JDF4_9EUKA|nr:hypothetical protein TRFO_36583 [Tritrichomonas foetus]|eukprot:OHS97230.1 hypothetical protein TRFO_36583 [Tritrichomonas foetus]